MGTLEFEFDLEDRVAKIRAVNEQRDLLNNSYYSYSGGKDSDVGSELLDIALPGNNIPRVFVNTGIEHRAIRQHVLKKAQSDKRFVIITPKVNIKKMLNSEGYPFKSKQHSQNYGVYFRNKSTIQELVKKIENNPKLAADYDFIHNLPRGTKSIIKYIFGTRERENAV